MRNGVPILVILLVSLGLVGCAGVGSSYSRPEAPGGPSGANAAPRTDCSAILGTAFHSEDERKWFADNCQKWPLAKYDSPAALTGPVAAGCAELKGRPYTSEDQRGWYLKNCVNTNPTANLASASTSPSDRHDCNAMRGTPYQSDTERVWYLANCNPNTVVQQSTTGPRTAQQAQAQTQLAPLGTVPGAPQQAYQLQPGTLCGLPVGAVDISLQALHRQVCGN